MRTKTPVVIHKAVKGTSFTVCGRKVYPGTTKTHVTFKGVTCGLCLRVKNKKVVKGLRKVKTRASTTKSEFPSGKLQ